MNIIDLGVGEEERLFLLPVLDAKLGSTCSSPQNIATQFILVALFYKAVAEALDQGVYILALSSTV